MWDAGRTMSRENVEIVRRVYDAVARRDAETVRALYDPEVEWDTSRLASEGMGTGLYRGLSGIRTFLRQWNEAWEDSSFDLEELIEAGEEVVSVVTRKGRGRASGIEVQAPGAVVWTIRGGKIVRVVLFPTRAEALKAAGLSE